MADEDAVWSATVDDGEFKVTVLRDEESQHNGELTVIHIPSDTTILTSQVGLSYGAIFGPDVSDVAAWQVMTLDAIDEWVAAREAGGSTTT